MGVSPDEDTGPVVGTWVPAEPAGRVRPYRDRGGVGRGLALAALILAILALAAAGVVAGVLTNGQRHDRQRLADTEASLHAARKSQAALGRQLAAERAGAATLAGQLQQTQQRLALDEKQLGKAVAALPPDTARLAANVRRSVVLVHCGAGFGSGFALNLPPAAGYGSVVVTAAHVVTDCAGTAGGGSLVVTRDGVPLAARLRGDDAAPGEDVALLDVVPRLPALSAAASVRAGEFVMAVGTPLSTELEGSVTTGNVSKAAPTYFTYTAPTSNGNSGGPLVDRDGKVLGFVDAGLVGTPDNPLAENVNIGLRLNVLCAQLLPAADCPY